MEVIKQWALSACAAVIVGTLVNMMAPNGKFEKVMKLAISTFFLCCLFSPFVLRSPALSFDTNSFFTEQSNSYASELEGQTNQQIYDQFRTTLRGYIEKSFAEMEVNANIIDIEIDEEETDPDKILKSVTVTLYDEYKSEEKKLRQTVKDITSLDEDAIQMIWM